MLRVMRLSSFVCALFGAASLIGCPGDDPADGAGGTGGSSEPTPEPCEAADIDACAIDQKGCALEGGEATCLACDAGMRATEDGSCQPIAGEPMQHTFGEFTTEPGEEVLGLCQSWTLNNETELWI